MDEKSIPDLLSQLIPDATEKNPGQGGEDTDEKNSILVDSLKALSCCGTDISWVSPPESRK